MQKLYLKTIFGRSFFATREIEVVEEFCLTCFMMTTNMKDFFLDDNEEFSKGFQKNYGGSL